MNTNELIDTLVGDLRPSVGNPVAMRLSVGIGGGIIFSAVAMLALIGPRPDFPACLSTAAFWIKFAYTLLLAVAGLWAVGRLARPAGHIEKSVVAAIVVLAATGLLAVAQYTAAPPAERLPLVMGSSASFCPYAILVLALPIYAGIAWAMRGLAPTRITLTGWVAGLAAGALAAWVYSFHCNETSTVFLALWYTEGMVLAGIVGGLTTRLLRW